MTRRRRSRTRSLPFPPRLLPSEQAEAADNYLLAYGYVARQGHRFEAVIDRDTQITECLVKLCEILDRSKKTAHDPKKARLSTFAYTCFFHHLSRLAATRARVVTVYIEDLPGELAYHPEPDESEQPDETDQCVET